jgi:hypothetical protein
VDTPQIDDVVIWFGGVAGALLAIVAVVVLLKKWLLGDLRGDLDDVRGQLRRNGGTSLRDAVDRIEERQTDIASDVRRVTERLDDHITFHLEEKR